MNSMADWRRALADVHRKLSVFPGVAGVGIGLRTSSLPDHTLVWRIYVSSTFAQSLPSELFGLKTEICVVRRGYATAGTPHDYTAGMQIETYVPSVFTQDPEGALGCFALDANQKPVLLSCSHVLFPGFNAIPGLAIYQPNYSSCCSGGDKIAIPVYDSTQIENGLFKGGFKTQLGSVQVPAPNASGYTTLNNETCTLTDCAIATLILNPNCRFRNVWKTSSGEIQIGGVNTDILSIPYTPAGTTPADESYVRIFSPVANQLMFGTLLWFKTYDGDPDGMNIGQKRLTPLYKQGISDSPQDDLAAGTLPSLNQFLILPRPAPIPNETDYTKFYAQPNQLLQFHRGDSGSVVIDYQGRVIAQIVRQLSLKIDQFLADPTQWTLIEFTSAANFGVASPIQGVLDQLQITIPDSFDQTVPSRGSSVSMLLSAENAEQPSKERRAIDKLRAELLALRRGRLVIGKIAQHRKEVRGLFARVRAIAAAWRELDGAAFYHEAVCNARDPGHAIPMVINGIDRAQLADALITLLMRHGSPVLQRDIERYGPWAVPLLLRIERLNDVPGLLAQRRSTA
jgi:hypothetical protein